MKRHPALQEAARGRDNNSWYDYVSNIGYHRDRTLTRANEFDLTAALASLTKPAIEVGGPSAPQAWRVLGEAPVPALFVSNVHAGGGYGDRRPHRDLLADARRLPFADSSLGAVFASGLPHSSIGEKYRPGHPETNDVRYGAITEAHRALDTGGLLVMTSLLRNDVQYAINQGFTPVSLLQSEGFYALTGPYSVWDAVFVKAEGNPEFSYSSEVYGSPDHTLGAVALGEVPMSAGPAALPSFGKAAPTAPASAPTSSTEQ